MLWHLLASFLHLLNGTVLLRGMDTADVALRRQVRLSCSLWQETMHELWLLLLLMQNLFWLTQSLSMWFRTWCGGCGLLSPQNGATWIVTGNVILDWLLSPATYKFLEAIIQIGALALWYSLDLLRGTTELLRGAHTTAWTTYSCSSILS